MKHQHLLYFLSIFAILACKAVIDIEPVITSDPTPDVDFRAPFLPTQEREQNDTQKVQTPSSSDMESMTEKPKKIWRIACPSL